MQRSFLEETSTWEVVVELITINNKINKAVSAFVFEMLPEIWGMENVKARQACFF